MTKAELEVREKVQNLYIIYRRIQWENICLLILGLLAPGKFASNLFIYKRIRQWLPIDPMSKRYLRNISNALYDLHQKRLIVKENIHVSIIGRKKFEAFCRENQGGDIREDPPKLRTYLAFRLPKEGATVMIGLPPKRIVNRLRPKISVEKKY